MERASRFIVEQRCGEKDADLFRSGMNTVATYILALLDVISGFEAIESSQIKDR